MKRYSMIIEILLIFTASFLFAADNAAQNQSIPVPVVFASKPFVRVGFSASFVGSPVEPSEKVNADSFSQVSGKKLVTKYWFMYAQSFTPERVKVSIIEASALDGQYNWSADFTKAEDKPGMRTSGIDTAYFSSQSPAVLLSETADSDTNRPRSYCWRFRATLYELPLNNDGTGSMSGSFTVKIESVS